MDDQVAGDDFKGDQEGFEHEEVVPGRDAEGFVDIPSSEADEGTGDGKICDHFGHAYVSKISSRSPFWRIFPDIGLVATGILGLHPQVGVSHAVDGCSGEGLLEEYPALERFTHSHASSGARRRPQTDSDSQDEGTPRTPF